MKKYLDRIAAACGVPDPAFGCRLILGIVEEARKKSEAYQKIVECIEWCSEEDESIGYIYHELKSLKMVDCPPIIPMKE